MQTLVIVIFCSDMHILYDLIAGYKHLLLCSFIRTILLGCGHSLTMIIIFNVLLWDVVILTQWEQLLFQGL